MKSDIAVQPVVDLSLNKTKSWKHKIKNSCIQTKLESEAESTGPDADGN